MEDEGRKRPIALFMAFGTKGDVYPIAAIAAAFSVDQKQYHVILMTHLAHESIRSHLANRHVTYVPISSPPTLSVQSHECDDRTGALETFLLQKRMITREHRRECFSAVERIFGADHILEADFIVINFFALEGWSLAELFRIRCMVAAPYVVPYSAPSTFERQFRKELPDLYHYLKEAPLNKVCWKDVTHWMWPLFTEDWGSWRSEELNLSSCPFTDPVTDLPTWHDWRPSPLLMYGFSKEIVEWPDYWPSNVRVTGFWFVPSEWQFSCQKCGEHSTVASGNHTGDKNESCVSHFQLDLFLKVPAPPIFVGLSSIGSMGLLRNPRAFLEVLKAVIETTDYRFILFTAGYEPLDAAICTIGSKSSTGEQSLESGISLFHDKLFCFSGCVPYRWLFPRCAAVIHHGGSGSTAAALHAGIPQIVCPFILDQFYWAEKMHWLGVAPEPIKRNHLVPDEINDEIVIEAATVLSKALHVAFSPRTKARASQVADIISVEDGVANAVKIIKEEMSRLDVLMSRLDVLKS